MSEEKSNGSVVWFSVQRGFGFIKPDNGDEDIFVHFSNIQVDGFKTLEPEQKVSYNIGKNDKGPQCVDVTVEDTDGF